MAKLEFSISTFLRSLFISKNFNSLIKDLGVILPISRFSSLKRFGLSHKLAKIAPVSYTHLDVYKRQVSRSWGGLQSQPDISLQMGLQGISFMHSDLGGFAGKNDCLLYTSRCV